MTAGSTDRAETSESGTALVRGPAGARIGRVVLLAPDDDARRALHMLLDRAGIDVAAMSELDHARRYVATHPVGAVIARADAATQAHAELGAPVIALVRPRDAGAAMALLDAGIAEVVGEPVDELAMTLALRHVAQLGREPAARPPAASPEPDAPAIDLAQRLVGDGEAMRRMRALVSTIAAKRTTVLIQGESGTGKELVARAIHDVSPRRRQRFVAINCAAIPATLLESELFGHTRGAFTDAVRDKPGLFEDASGGTLFLDEVGELPLALQAKLLRVLQESEIRRVGDNEVIRVDVRLVAATLRDLAEEVAAGRFREDLYYRLNVLPIKIPALRERAEDIPQLARFFAQRHAQRHALGDVELTDEAVAALAQQPWPGNVRELENVLERAIVLADRASMIDLAFLGTMMNLQAPPAEDTEDVVGAGSDELSIKKATRELERTLIARALVVTQGNRTNAAKLLEISHRALLYKMKEYGIS